MTRPFQSLKGKSLISAWDEAQTKGMSRTQHAALLGMSARQYDQRLYVERRKLPPVPESRYPVHTGAVNVTGDALVLCDLHIPFHNSDFVNNCIQVAMSWGIDTVILAGDVIEAHAFSHWPEGIGQANKSTISVAAEGALMDAVNLFPADVAAKMREVVAGMSREPGNISEEITETKKVLGPLFAHFSSIIWFMGNHEDRITRLLNKSMSSVDLAALFGGSSPKLKLSEYYYCTLVSSGVLYRVTHPKGAAKGSSKKLSMVYDGNIIMAHNHHLSIQSDPSGKRLCVEPGMCADLERLDYQMMRDSTSDRPQNGAVIVRDGKPWLLNRWSDWERLKLAV